MGRRRINRSMDVAAPRQSSGAPERSPMRARKLGASALAGIALVAVGFLASGGATPVASGGRYSSGSKPMVPRTGAYLGAWVNPLHLPPTRRYPAVRELQQLAPFEAAIGRHLDILHVYAGWKVPAPIDVLGQVSATGALPMIDWSCGDSDANVAAGKDDALIRRYAKALAAYRSPVFLRWYYEMDLINAPVNAKCRGGATDPAGIASGYVAAWRRIWSDFQAVGASNVAFVWAPSVKAFGPSDNGLSEADKLFYPGNRYVDWVAADGYAHKALSFAELFGSFYRRWSPSGKPLMISETGAEALHQVDFLRGAQQALPAELPAIKALMYFDSSGKYGQWALVSDGLHAFAALGGNPYFRPLNACANAPACLP